MTAKSLKQIIKQLLLISYMYHTIAISKHNSKHKNQVILLMITDNEKWHYLAVKKLSALFCKITSKPDEGFEKEHENVCKNHDYCYIEMPKEEIILKHSYGEKSTKIPFIIYADMESLLEKMDIYHSNPEKTSATKISKHTASGYSLFMHCSFDATKKQA